MQKLIGKMARMYPLMIAMGFMIVIIAFLIGYYNAQVAADYFANAKSVRETSLLAQRAFFESTTLWLPAFKFLGLGLILGGIVMALRVIIDNLRAGGAEVLSNIPADRRPKLPGPPWYGLLMPVVMMVGEIFFLVALGFGLYAASLANSVFSNPIAQIDAAGAGSALLAQVQTIHAIEAWLVPLKFFGVSTEFLAIAMGLSTNDYLHPRFADQHAGPPVGRPAGCELGKGARLMKPVATPKSPWQLKAFPIFSVLGWVLIGLSFLIGLLVLTPTAMAYWGGSAKAVRDAAEAGTVLLGQLALLATVPRWLEPLAFVGVASFMVGIALEFSSIPALLVGAFVLSPAQSTFFSDAKAVREGAASGSAFVQANVTRHAIEAWVPQFKFFGLGLGLMAIVMALGTIAKRLRRMGMIITNHMPAGVRPAVPPPPKTVRLFQLSTLMGLMILMVALIVGIVLAVTIVPDYWNHSIANELNVAEPGSALLGQLGIVSSFAFWLNPLRLLGMALLFTGITLALMVIIGTLRLQAKLLVGFYRQASGSRESEPTDTAVREPQLKPSPGLAASAE